MEVTLWENTLKEDRRQGGGGTAHVDVRRVTTHPIAPILLRSIDMILANRLFLCTLHIPSTAGSARARDLGLEK